jgi:hypothetical protein
MDQELSKKQKRCLRIFMFIWGCYIFLFCCGFFYIKKHVDFKLFLFPLTTGAVLGSIYFAVAGYTFYDLFLVRKGQNNRSETAGEVSLGKMLSWLMPVLVMVSFVCASFWLTYDLPVDDTANRGIYFSHPYFLGKIYRDTEAIQGDKLTSPALAILINKSHGIHFFASDEIKDAVAKHKELSTQERAESLAHIHKIPFHIAFAFSFIGVLLFTLTDVVRRFKDKDLYPKTFISYQIRFILAISLAVVIANYYMDYWPVNSAPLLFLGIGMFPGRAMDFMEKKARSILSLEKEEQDVLPLTRLQGMSSYYYERFREINVTDVQNLAQSDLVYLRKNMSCGSRMIADFVAQAVLVAQFPTGNFIDLLRVRGVRDIVGLRDALKAEDPKIMAILDLTRDELLAILDSSALKTRIDILREMKQESDNKDKKKFVHPRNSKR